MHSVLQVRCSVHLECDARPDPQSQEEILYLPQVPKELFLHHRAFCVPGCFVTSKIHPSLEPMNNLILKHLRTVSGV